MFFGEKKEVASKAQWGDVIQKRCAGGETWKKEQNSEKPGTINLSDHSPTPISSHCELGVDVHLKKIIKASKLGDWQTHGLAADI